MALHSEKRCSLDLSDVEADAYIRDLLQDDPRVLHRHVASAPLAATRCFHDTVRLVIRTLFNCEARPGLSADSVAASETPGILGHVRAYLGVVAPQLVTHSLLNAAASRL